MCKQNALIVLSLYYTIPYQVMLYCTMPLYYAFVLCTLKMKHKKESCTMSNYKILWHTRTMLYYVELQNIMAQKNHIVLCRITKYELTLYYVGRNVLFFLFKSINSLIFFFHSCAVFTIVLMIFPGIGPVIYFTAICSQLSANMSIHVLCE